MKKGCKIDLLYTNIHLKMNAFRFKNKQLHLPSPSPILTETSDLTENRTVKCCTIRKRGLRHLGQGLAWSLASPCAAGSVHDSLHVQSRVVSEEPVHE